MQHVDRRPFASYFNILAVAGAVSLAWGCTDTGANSDVETALSYGFGPTESYEKGLALGWIAAGQPTPERLQEVLDEGGVVISLRYADEEPFDERSYIEERGGVFVRHATDDFYLKVSSFRTMLYSLLDEQDKPGNIVYLHCKSANRVGAFWALYQAEHLGVPAEDALEMGRQAGMGGMEPLVRDILGVDDEPWVYSEDKDDGDDFFEWEGC